MNIAAFDLSLTQTGYAVASGGETRHGTIRPTEKGMERLSRIRGRVLELSAGADLVVLEGYSFGAKGSAFLSLAEMGGVVRYALWNAGRPFVEIPPATLKKFATGKGTAPKEEMLAAAIRRLEYSGANHNEADALWLLTAGLHAFGASRVELPATNREALQKVSWPTISAGV